MKCAECGQRFNNGVNFTSRINLVDSRIFNNKFSATQKTFNFIDYPWTPKEITKAANVWTDRIKTCTAGGIITKNLDGSRDVVMFHLNPANAKCLHIANVKEALIDKVGNAKPVQALIMGSKDDKSGGLKISEMFFDAVEDVINKTFNVPITKLKGIPLGGYSVDTFYEAQKDEWTILNRVRDTIPYPSPERKNTTGFAEVKLSKLDKLVFDKE